MSARELLAEIQKLPMEEQREPLEALKRNVEQPTEAPQPISEDEVERILQAKGIIAPPDSADYTDEDEDFEPIEVEGKPLSETIIEERR